MVAYYENPAISQSKLKLLLTNPSLFNTVREPELFYEEKKHFVIGSAVDCILTTPQEFDRTYHVSDIANKPTDVVKSILNQIYDCVKEDEEIYTIDQYSELILQFYLSHEYQGNWKPDTKVTKICENWEYFEDLKASVGKQILSIEEKTLIDSISMSLKTNDKTAPYFQEVPRIHKYYQLPLFFTYQETDCKVLLDLVIFDHENQTIQPIDIKTLGDYTINFPQSLRKRRYDIQAAFYTEALSIIYPEYVILPFKFIVESTIQPGVPLIYTCSPSLLYIGKHGRRELLQEGRAENGHSHTISRVAEVKGFKQLIELYKYYTFNGFDLDQIVRENNSELELDWSGIIV